MLFMVYLANNFIEFSEGLNISYLTGDDSADNALYRANRQERNYVVLAKEP